MLPVKDLVSARVGDVAVGNIVAHRIGGRYVYGITVRGLGTPTPGLLVLEPVEHFPQVPTFVASNDYCLDLKTKPILQWSGKTAALSSSFEAIPQVGHLLVAGSTRLISGTVAGRIGFGSEPVYWDLATGEVVNRPDYATSTYIAEWRLGVQDDDGKFHELATFQLKR